MDNPPGAENWAAVSDAIRERMRQLKVSKAGLARETGLSETTIRYIGRSPHGHHKSALVAISAVLRWRHDHLMNILHERPDKNTSGKPPAGTSLDRLLRAEVRSLKDEISRLKEVTQATSKQIDKLLALGPDPGMAVNATHTKED